jgi:hypothetical protein
VKRGGGKEQGRISQERVFDGYALAAGDITDDEILFEDWDACAPSAVEPNSQQCGKFWASTEDRKSASVHESKNVPLVVQVQSRCCDTFVPIFFPDCRYPSRYGRGMTRPLNSSHLGETESLFLPSRHWYHFQP